MPMDLPPNNDVPVVRRRRVQQTTKEPFFRSVPGIIVMVCGAFTAGAALTGMGFIAAWPKANGVGRESDASRSDTKEVNSPKKSLTEHEISEFIDNLNKYDGQTITVKMKLVTFVGVIGQDSLRNYSLPVVFEAEGSGNAKLQVSITLPSDKKKVPVAFSGDILLVTYISKGGNGEAIEFARP